MSSMNLDFFAAADDQIAVLDFLFNTTDVRVFESYSEPNRDIREFIGVSELCSAFPVGQDINGNGSAILLQLWSPSVMSNLTITRFALDPNSCNGNHFRHRIDGGGLIQLYFGGVCGQVITKSHLGHQSETRAQNWGTDQGINWNSLKKLSNIIRYHIRKRLSVAKVPGCPVLAQAYELARSGYSLKLAVQTPWAYELSPHP